MPNSPHNPQSLAGDLRAYLKDVLPHSQLVDAPVNPNYHPLLLLQTGHSMAAFAFSNGDVRKSYDAIYESFKHYYAKQQGHWDALDLSFVFCVQPGEPNLDLFCSSVETNVYFCRKFVVQLAPPLDSSLARLPFLPLRPLYGNSPRPASAQTFLQQSNVPALLAKYLAVQHERGPERIAEDCTTGKFGEPQKLTAATPALSVQAASVLEPVRLETVTIENFRAYRKAQTFAIGADATVLYGPNGFGKTSFFDAVDFAVTGGIGRFDSLRDANFAKAARHLDSSSEESVVSLYVQCGGAVRKVRRTVSSPKRAVLDGRSADRKTILAELMGAGMPVTDRVENSVSLFRATHLFSQDQQELTKYLQTDCQLPAHIVSRMLAFDDYANAISKASRVCDVLGASIANATREIKELTEQISDDKRELERLGQSSQQNTNLEALDAELDALRGKLGAVGITVGTEQTDAAVVRGWRAAVESRHAASQSRSDRLSALIKEAAALSRTRVEIASLQQQVALGQQALAAAEERRLACEQALQQVEQRLAESGAKRAEAQAFADVLDWVQSTKPVFLKLVARIRTLNEDLAGLDLSLVQLRATEATAAGDLRTHESLVARATDTFQAKRSEFATIQSISNSIAHWEANRNRLSTVLQLEQDLLGSLAALRVEESELSPRLSLLKTDEGRLVRQIAELDKDQSELRVLLSEIQGHIRNGTCPLCGENHGSKNELLFRIEKHVASDVAGGARTDLARVQEQAKYLIESVSINKQKQQGANSQLAGLAIERARLESDIARIETSATGIGIALSTQDSGPSAVFQLQERANSVQREVEELSRNLEELRTAATAARTRLENTKDLVTAKSGELNELRTALPRLEEELILLRDDPRLTTLSLENEDEELESQRHLNLEHLIEFKAASAIAQNEATEEKVKLSALRQECAALKTRLSNLGTQLANLQRAVTQVIAQFAAANLPSDANEATLLNLIAEESRTQAQLVALRDSTSSLELALDAATTAAALTSLRQSLRNRERAIENAVQERTQSQPWLKYFETLASLASSEQSAAIANFIEAYGPRTSVIQRRLRSVYGFDDIAIRSHESTISVRVTRHGEELRPTDYFSQSQQQTLALGLFLTACSAQTASAFSPVFLDDPVTHFDDLNIYAFLDLIVGLLDSDFGRRQFIMSTCDDKLLQLARQKFRHLGDRAKFYHFSAIGDDGPIVDEITTSL